MFRKNILTILFIAGLLGLLFLFPVLLFLYGLIIAIWFVNHINKNCNKPDEYNINFWIDKKDE